MAVLLAVTFGAVQIGSAVVARHRAQAADDVAALAAATLMPAGVPAACDEAAAVARAMRTVVRLCTAEALDVTVVVDARLPFALGNFVTAQAVARAGPAASVRDL